MKKGQGNEKAKHNYLQLKHRKNTLNQNNYYG